MPFVARVLEHVKASKVFKPPNPWTAALFALLAELHALDLKLTLKFDIEILCKNVAIELKGTPPPVAPALTSKTSSRRTCSQAAPCSSP
jgi:CCR4-NOT transcription complex subunit 1